MPDLLWAFQKRSHRVQRPDRTAQHTITRLCAVAFQAAPAIRNVAIAAAAWPRHFSLRCSGCGKSASLRMIAGLESPTSGRILIAGQDVTTLGPAQRNVSLVFQRCELFPHMSVIDDLSYGLQQRVALARALEPAMLLFDEPLSNLDARLRRAMREEIRAPGAP